MPCSHVGWKNGDIQRFQRPWQERSLEPTIIPFMSLGLPLGLPDGNRIVFALESALPLSAPGTAEATLQHPRFIHVCRKQGIPEQLQVLLDGG
jgi:hypothetical protein